MTTRVATDEWSSTHPRLAPDTVDLILDRLSAAARGERQSQAVADVRWSRTLIEDCVPHHPTGPTQLGALPKILGMVVTLQYPLMQLELFFGGQRSDITRADQAELYISFIRYHLWKLEQLLRESTRA
jgi:hypothetical protein